MVVSSLSCQSKSVLGVPDLDRLEGRVAKAGSNTRSPKPFAAGSLKATRKEAFVGTF